MSPTDPRLALGGLPVLVWTAGPDGACDYLNQRWTEYTGTPVADLLGWGWADRIHPEDRERVLTDYRRAMSDRSAVRLEFRALTREGEYRWLLSTGEPRFGEDGEFLGYAGCATDVTERRALEQRAGTGLRNEVAQLAGGIANDLNNLLTGILGLVALMSDDDSLSRAARDDLAQIEQAASRAATLSRRLLAFGPRPALAPQFLDLNQVVAGAVPTIRQVVGAPIEVVQELADGVQPVLADPSQLEQVLLQLGGYARRSMPAGGRLLLRTGHVRVPEVAEGTGGLRPGCYVTLEVSDTGPGLAPEALARVLEPPTAAMRAADPMPDLSLVAGVARQTGGHVTVRSVAGEGTTFTLYIPRFEAPPEPRAESDLPSRHGTETILLVEDDAQVREVARRALERSGYTVLEAGDAEAAIAVADRHPGYIHLLIADVALPGMSGREVAARLGIHRPAIKVLYVSGTSDATVLRHQLLEPDIEFLEKPFSLDTLLRKVGRVLGVTIPAEDPAAWDQRSLV